MNFVDRIFVGELTNTIMCEECEHVSVGGRAEHREDGEACPRGFMCGTNPLCWVVGLSHIVSENTF